MPHIELDASISLAVLLLLLLAAVALSSFLYHHTVPPVPRSKRLVLIALRSAVLALILGFLAESVLRFTSTERHPPALAVLIDDSKSMGITDRTGDRRSALLRALRSTVSQSLPHKANFVYYAFGAQLKPLAGPPADSLPLLNDETDISAALRSLGAQRDAQNLRAALLLSDGAYTTGQNPIHEAENLTLPVYTVGIGDSTEQKDLTITKIAANDIAYRGTVSPIDVTVKSSGFQNQKVDVTLSEGGTVLDRQPLLIGEGTREYPVRLSFPARDEGPRKYTVRVSDLPGELTARNNRRTLFVRVLRNKLSVAIIAGTPSPDVSILRQTLAEDTSLTVHCLTQRGTDSFYGGTIAAGLLDTADCVVLIGFPTSSTGPATIGAVAGALTARSRPLLFVGGKQIDFARLRQLEPILPFGWSMVSTLEEYVFITPADAQRTHPVLRLGEHDPLVVWNRLPPLFRTQTAFRAKPEATVLGTAQVQGIPTAQPLIVARRIAGPRSIAVLAYGLWRWRLMTAGSPDTEEALATFLSNCVKWLTSREEAGPLKVSTTRQLYTAGEPVEFIGQAYDQSAQPLSDALIRVSIRHEEREMETILRPIGHGRYEGIVEGLGEGDYLYTATATHQGVPHGQDAGRFAVGGLNLEYQETRMNSQLLRQLAARTGGLFFLADSLQSLSASLSEQPSFVPREITTSTAVELWNWHYSLALTLVLLTVEWFIRRRSGML